MTSARNKITGLPWLYDDPIEWLEDLSVWARRHFGLHAGRDVELVLEVFARRERRLKHEIEALRLELEEGKPWAR